MVMYNPFYYPLILLCVLSLPLLGIPLLFWAILRRRDVTRPSCRACGFDLRQCNYLSGIPEQCPQCSHTFGRRGVRFGHDGRPWKRIVTALVLFLSPLCFWVVARPSSGRPEPHALTTPQLLQQMTSQRLDTAMPELTTRLKANRLSASEIDDILAYLLRNAQGFLQGYIPGRDSAAEFLLHARSRKELDRVAIATIAKAVVQSPFPQPTSWLANKGGQTVRADFVDFQSYPEVRRHLLTVVSMRQLLLSDGTVLYDRASAPDADAHATFGYIVHLPLQHTLSTGTHKVTAILDCGVVEADPPLLGTGGTPGIPSKWYKPLALWEEQSTTTITVP